MLLESWSGENPERNYYNQFYFEQTGDGRSKEYMTCVVSEGTSVYYSG